MKRWYNKKTKIILKTYTLDVDHRTHCGLDLIVTGLLLIQILTRIGESRGTISDNSAKSLPLT